MGIERKKRFAPPAAVGGTSLLTAFAVLCLTVFALLCLSTVQADVRLADASARSVEEYYDADCRAQEILARLRAGEQLDEVSYSNGIFSYSCPISDTKALEVEVQLEGSEYTVLRWQSVATEEWESNNTLELWDGTAF
ncbi:hypothetical protein IMSAG049_01681 [Clostridiales bacterium]|nr:hypothetical protein IMSAG049_01681 [Clostridiales bacterium]